MTKRFVLTADTDNVFFVVHSAMVDGNFFNVHSNASVDGNVDNARNIFKYIFFSFFLLQLNQTFYFFLFHFGEFSS